MMKGRIITSKPKKYTTEEKEFIMDNKHLGPMELSKVMDISYNSIRAYFKNHKIRSNISTQFSKGHEPWNTGTTGLMKANSGSFQKGRTPHNTKFDGAITVRKETSTQTAYKYIRISKNEWMLYQRYLWEQTKGPIPEGSLVTFKNGNPMDCVTENLELISKKDNMANNTLHNYPEEIVKAYQMIGAITRKLNNHAKKQNNRS